MIQYDYYGSGCFLRMGRYRSTMGGWTAAASVTVTEDYDIGDYDVVYEIMIWDKETKKAV